MRPLVCAAAIVLVGLVRMAAYAAGERSQAVASYAGCAAAYWIALAVLAVACRGEDTRALRLAVLAAIAVAFVLQAVPQWDAVEAFPDSRSYFFTVAEGGARPPAVRTVAALVADPVAIREECGKLPENALALAPASQSVRLVQAGKVAVLAGVLALAAALMQRVRAPLVGAFALGAIEHELPPRAMIGWMREALAAAGGALAVLALVALAAAGWWLRTRRSASRPTARALLANLLAAGLAAHLAVTLGVMGFVTRYYNAVLSEPLSQAFLFMTVASLLRYQLQGEVRWLHACATAAAAMYLTRPAAVFAGVLVAAGVLLAVRRGRWRAAVPAAVLYAALCAAPSAYVLATTGQLQVNGAYAGSRIRFALEIADAGDLERMPDAQARTFLERAMALKRDVDARESSGPRGPEVYLVANLYRVASVVAADLTGPGRGADADALMLRVATPILAAKRARYLAIVADSLHVLAHDATRLRPFWPLCVACALLALLAGGEAGAAAAVLLAAHLAHLLVICAFDVPIPRYVNASEILVVTAELLLVAALLPVERPR